MKRKFFTLIIACSTAFVALPLEHGLTAQEPSNQAIVQRDDSFGPFSASINNASLESMGPQAKKHHHSDSDSSCIGPTGHPGPIGPQGDTGPTGTIGSSGVSSAYGSFVTQETTSVAPGAPILFTSTSFASGSVTLQPAGAIQLTQTGDYLVTFGASQSLSNAQIALTLNTNVVPGTNLTLPFTVPDQLSTVSTIVRVTTVPATLQVINNSSTSSSFTIGTNLGFDISAFITIEQVHN